MPRKPLTQGFGSQDTGRRLTTPGTVVLWAPTALNVGGVPETCLHGIDSPAARAGRGFTCNHCQTLKLGQCCPLSKVLGPLFRSDAATCQRQFFPISNGTAAQYESQCYRIRKAQVPIQGHSCLTLQAVMLYSEALHLEWDNSGVEMERHCLLIDWRFPRLHSTQLGKSEAVCQWVPSVQICAKWQHCLRNWAAWPSEWSTIAF